MANKRRTKAPQARTSPIYTQPYQNPQILDPNSLWEGQIYIKRAGRGMIVINFSIKYHSLYDNSISLK